jgi:hypothetical protein
MTISLQTISSISFLITKRRRGCRRAGSVQFSLLQDFYPDCDFKVARAAQEMAHNKIYEYVHIFFSATAPATNGRFHGTPSALYATFIRACRAYHSRYLHVHRNGRAQPSCPAHSNIPVVVSPPVGRRSVDRTGICRLLCFTLFFYYFCKASVSPFNTTRQLR